MPSSSADERFHTPRNSARRAGYASSEDERFTTPRGAISSRSISSDYDTPRCDAYSSDEHEPFYSGRDDSHTGVSMMQMPFVAETYSTENHEHSYESHGYSGDYYNTGWNDEYSNDQYYNTNSEYYTNTDADYYNSKKSQEYEYEVSQNDIADIFSLTRHNKVMHVEDLLDQGIPVNIRDSYGNTILSIACQNGLKKMAKTALRRGADINTRNYRGNTPLHFCFAYGYGDTLGEYLISKGGDVTITNEDGITCYEKQ